MPDARLAEPTCGEGGRRSGAVNSLFLCHAPCWPRTHIRLWLGLLVPCAFHPQTRAQVPLFKEAATLGLLESVLTHFCASNASKYKQGACH